MIVQLALIGAVVVLLLNGHPIWAIVMFVFLVAISSPDEGD